MVGSSVILTPVNPVVVHPPHYLHELPLEDEERLEKIFKRLDVDGNGKIDIHDLSVALKDFGVHHRYAQKFLERSDSNKSGDISLAEFIHYVKEHEKNLRLGFSHIDKNKDGKIDLEELIRAFKELGIEVERHEAKNLLQRMDKDGSLEITFNEWRDFLLYAPSTNIHELIVYWRHSIYLDIGEDLNVPDDFTQKEMMTGMWWRQLVAGGVAGAVSRTCTAPVDRAKVFFQVYGTKDMCIKGCVKKLVNEGGFTGMWRGNGINVLKIAPESAFKFMAYEQAKKFIRSNNGNQDLTIYERFSAGSFAGVTSQTLIYPLEVMKTRLALRKTGEYKSMFDAARKIATREGVKSFYRGYIPNTCGIIPYAGIDLAVYETLKNHYLSQNRSEAPSPFLLLACGTVSSTCGQFCSYPLALIRTKLQAKPQSQHTMVSLLKEVYQQEGVAGLYRGITMNLLKVVPAVSISYIVYEYSRHHLGVTMTT